MPTFKTDQPIGIFDSGIGGLTVTRALVEQLPHESIVYFGDTAHLPYGDKSARVIQDYAKKIIDFLLECNVKLILIACNSASAAAYEMLQNYIGDHALLVNVIDPVVKFVGENYAAKRVGLIGTKLTVQSQIYQQKIATLRRQIDLCALATPLLVPIIEEGIFKHELINIALNEYLSHPTLQNIEALILGCTHYPVIKKSIVDFYKDRIDIIDASKVVASEVEAKLIAHGLARGMDAVVQQNNKKIFDNYHFYVSDLTESFAKGTRLFFGEEIKVEYLNIF